MPTLELSAAQRQHLASRKIFFGHQSVGDNILQGIKEILTSDGRAPALRVVRSAAPSEVTGPALVESAVGENGNPASKAAAFAAAVAGGVGPDGGIAMYKYCFVDLDASTDARRLFEAYRTGIDQVKARRPELTIVHITVPLTVVEPPARAMAKRLLGRPTMVDANARRNEYNQLLRAAYGSREPIFDLALLESTRTDGSRSYVMRGRDTVYTLAPEYTDDGGHLNERGRRLAAARLLALLASL